MSRESITRYKKKDHSSSDESLPEEWTSVQKRLDYLETSMIKMQKRSQKLQKKIEDQNEQLVTFKRDTRKLIQEVFNDQKNILATREKQLEFENMKAELDDLHNYIKRVDKKSSEIIKQFKNNAGGGLNDSMIDEKIEEKVEIIFEKHQRDIDRAVGELKQMVKDFARDQTPIDRRSNENILANSRSKQSLQKSAQKSGRASYTDIAINQDVSIDTKQPKCKSPQPVNNASSRVNYLKQKLKEFQETNRKFQEKFDKKSPVQEQKKTVQKMKDFKNYLQQSQSELDQSNLEVINPHNVLTESIKNYRNKYYQ